MAAERYLRPRDIGLKLDRPTEEDLRLWLTAIALGAGRSPRSRGRRLFESLRKNAGFAPGRVPERLETDGPETGPGPATAGLGELYSAINRGYGSVQAIHDRAADHGDLRRRLGLLPGFHPSLVRRLLAGLQLAWPKARPFPGEAERYDRWFQANEAVFRAEAEALRAILPPGVEGVEIGGGSGRFAKELGIGTIVEPDPALGGLAETRKLRVLTAAAEELPFADQSLDLVLMVTVICFFVLPQLPLAEAWRVLRPGGRLVIGIVDAGSTLGRRLRRHREPGSFYRFAQFFSVPRLTKMLETSGFTVDAYRQTLFEEAVSDHFEVREGYGDGGFVAIRARLKR